MLEHRKGILNTKIRNHSTRTRNFEHLPYFLNDTLILFILIPEHEMF